MSGVRHRKRKPSAMFLLVVAMLAMLPVLAVLQYRWVGQVSQSERDRMQANLRAGAGRFKQDFDREVTRIFLGLQPDEADSIEAALNKYPERFRRWHSAAPYPQLVKDVFRVEAGEGGPARFSRLDDSASRFEADVWPEEMSSLREQLGKDIEAAAPGSGFITEDVFISRAQPPPIVPRAGLMIQTAASPIVGDIPALVIPIRRIELPQEGGRIKITGPPSFVIIRLDIDYIKHEFIPELARRYFSSSDELDYNLTVVSGEDANRVIYQSEPGAAVSSSASDATVAVLALHPEDLDALLREMLPHTRSLTKGESREFRQMTLRVFSNTRKDGALRLKTADATEGAWQVLLKHRAGSLEAVVAGARRRNLILSFGILLILAASMVMVVVSTQRAQRLARRQMEFVAGVSHELRTPLAVISSAAENLADGVINDNRRVQQYGTLIKGESRRLTEMVEQVLEFAGAESGRKTYDLRPVEVGELIEDAVQACRSQIEEAGFDIEREIASRPLMVRADPETIKRALQNLISNAIKYSGSSRWIKIKADQSGDHTLITVEDRGIGIAPDELPHIFEPFRRGREVSAAQIHGNGLGLSLVKNIIEAHGGQVTVESRPGRGSSFTLHLKSLANPEKQRDKLSGLNKVPDSLDL
jgi:signal transduction histidine kinase